jgi:hypothetical protein
MGRFDGFLWIARRFRCLYLSLFYMDESAVLVVGAVDSWITAGFVPGFAVFAGGIRWRTARRFPRAGGSFPRGDLWISSLSILIPKLSRSYPRFCAGYTAGLHMICAYYPQPCPHRMHRAILIRGSAPGRRRGAGLRTGRQGHKAGCESEQKHGCGIVRNTASVPLIIHKASGLSTKTGGLYTILCLARRRITMPPGALP